MSSDYSPRAPLWWSRPRRSPTMPVTALLVASAPFLLAACATYQDSLEPMVLMKPVLIGWVWSEVQDSEWQDSEIGFGLSAYVAEAWYDVVGAPMHSATADQREEVSAYQLEGPSRDPSDFSSYQGPLVYVNVVRADLIRQESNIGLVSRNASSYVVDVRVTLLDVAAGREVYAHGSGDAERTAGSALLTLREGTMEFENSAGYIAVQRAIREALEKMEPVVTIQGEI